jgi:hypothetical protein
VAGGVRGVVPVGERVRRQSSQRPKDQREDKAFCFHVDLSLFFQGYYFLSEVNLTLIPQPE